MVPDKNDLLHLVGSIPYNTVTEVFETFGRKFGLYLRTMPDGEIGPRRHWISRIHYQVLAGHPQLEIINQPRPDDGVERLLPHDNSDRWQFRVRPDVSQVRFGEPGWRLGYSRDAMSSFEIFRLLKENGTLPQHLLFQVSIPSVTSALPPLVFPVKGDLDKIRGGYETALRLEIEKLCELIPHNELAIQFDCSTEIHQAYASDSGVDDGSIERNSSFARNLASVIPHDIELGYHLCFGTLGGWPRFAPDNLGQAVKLANALITGSGRRVNWIHIPALDRSDDHFYSPLADLRSDSIRVYLGILHNMDGFESRAATARRYLPTFGISAYCGFGRCSQDELPGILADHLQAVSSTVEGP